MLKIKRHFKKDRRLENRLCIRFRADFGWKCGLVRRENQQVASFVISHVQRWHDPKLQWEPEKFNGLKQVVMPQYLVWVPKLFIYNSMDTKNMLTEDRYDVRVQHTGHVKINIPQFVTTLCRIDIDLFPFDTQGNAEWEVMNVTVRQMKFMEDGEYRAEVHYILHLNRRPIYYITVIVVPTFLISALSILGIFSPGSNDGPRNEKVSLGLGSLLAMTVLLDIVAGAMPKSNSIPLLGFYIIVVIMLCAIGVAISMALLGMSRSYIQTEQLPSKMAYRPRFPDLAAIYNQLIEVSRAQRTYRERMERSQWSLRVEKEWNKIFSRIDHVFLFLFQSANVLVLLMFLRYAFIPVPELPEDFTV
ncbi:Neurotransmitter-gated ion-channel ligand binding domain protein [Teladorsagia circumcincta]|uniref:Neurotransmitter-gated ion-channel ligand binding domain protein n=2 Tax=Teladorsagia circumcincta TaxID=45464 RepID=A0A2G9UQC0_TELCI|nr:Neurotransmitter-gated ion-channel ligand binding domain protein [Teladorsagia circumcincta]